MKHHNWVPLFPLNTLKVRLVCFTQFAIFREGTHDFHGQKIHPNLPDEPGLLHKGMNIIDNQLSKIEASVYTLVLRAYFLSK